MKNTFFFAILALLLLNGCNEPVAEVDSENDRISQKYEPSDEFFLQRMGTDGRFSIQAYSDGLKQAQQSAQVRSANGFDEEWTVQGPGNIGARVNTVVVNPINESVMYAGFSSGGVFKTTDNGLNWSPIFDDQTFLAIGDIALDPNDPETVYVGTGDVNISGYPFIGDGLYRSTNGGDTWTHLGLEEQRIISKVVIDPSDSERIFVATMGLPFERNDNRGLYRSVDNGNSWEQILFLSDSTGVIDVLINPENPQILYAAGWDRIRNNTESTASGQGARIYKSIDGGDTWNVLTGGLPNADHSRIGLAMSGTDPDVIFAQYTGDNFRFENIYKTNDGGMNWDTIPSGMDNGLGQFPLGGFGWYFGKIRINPDNDDDIFLLGVDLWRTQDGGNTWNLAAPDWWTYEVHADKHDLIFTPSGNIILATDGGLYRSNLNTSFWEDIENIPTTQFYRVAYNPHAPNAYFGGAQDNGTTGGNEATISEWSRIYGGDGFQTAFDPVNPNRFFVETQRGGIAMTLDNGSGFFGATEGIESSDRRNWDMPYFISPHNPEVLYTGTYRVYKGEGEIPFWSAISEDLTDDSTEPHRYRNISTIDESPLIEGLLYAGTGDGNVWRSDDGGNSWLLISSDLPDLYVTDVKASPDVEDRVFATFSGYRDNDFLPRVFRSDDRGNTWVNISSDLPDLAVNELLILPNYADSILFVATDGGVYGTISEGENWNRLGVNMPIITVYDLAFNEVKNELVAGTFARSIMSYPLDSIASFDDIVSTSIVDYFPKGALSVFPTLAQDKVNIELSNIEIDRNFEIAIINSSGQLLQHFEGAGEQGNFQIDISGWSPGTYFVKAKMRHEIVTEQFVKIEN